MTTIGKNIRKLRKERGMTQEELATRLNISAQAVSKWEMETCSPDISLIVPLSTLFGVSADVLFGISPDGMEKEIEETKILQLTEFQQLGSPMKIVKAFGGKEAYEKAVKELEDEIFSA